MACESARVGAPEESGRSGCRLAPPKGSPGIVPSSTIWPLCSNRLPWRRADWTIAEALSTSISLTRPPSPSFALRLPLSPSLSPPPSPSPSLSLSFGLLLGKERERERERESGLPRSLLSTSAREGAGNTPRIRPTPARARWNPRALPPSLGERERVREEGREGGRGREGMSERGRVKEGEGVRQGAGGAGSEARRSHHPERERHREGEEGRHRVRWSKQRATREGSFIRIMERG
eukprot:scaffold142255_cov30-Tisochrysis_lutea.AAC.7